MIDAADDERERHRHGMEQVALDVFREQQAEHRGRDEGDDQVAVRARGRSGKSAPGTPRPPRASRRSGWRRRTRPRARRSKPSRSPARIRWPVLEIGRNSVMPSTRPRISACSELVHGWVFTRKSATFRQNSGWLSVVLWPASSSTQPALGPAPGLVQAARVHGRNHLVARPAMQSSGAVIPGARLDRVERMAQQQLDRQERVVVLGHFHQAVERGHEHHRLQRPLRGEEHRRAAAQAAAERDHLLRAQLLDGVRVPAQRVGR